MNGPKGNSQFCFPKTFNVSQAEGEGYIKVEGKQNSMFPMGPVNSKLEKKLARKRLPYSIWLTNLPWFQGARPDHVQVESLHCCFPN